jgi:7-cyano-7-deazaguanine synthase in queuosine biosynthesis
MTTISETSVTALPSVQVHVVEPGAHQRKGWLRCEIGKNLEFITEKMESYFFAQWTPLLYDALLVAAAVEFCDRTKHRTANVWARNIELRIPVHDPDQWNTANVSESLHDALNFLTGDVWQFSFYGRKHTESAPRQALINLGKNVTAVIPFSEGLDSRAVAGIMDRKLGNTLVRVRLGTKELDGSKLSRRRQPFTSVPYKVRPGEKLFVESSARSRGFKFTLISGLAAYLANAGRIIIPESAQGALGPTLVPVGQAYVDYRSHPLFTGRMEKFLDALLGYKVKFEFPQLWQTKGETLKQFVSECDGASTAWLSTWSCWQQNRQVSVNNKKRQCGICAACMLRRLSVHAADLNEPKTNYVWEDLSAETFDAGAAPSFDRKKITGAMREYAIAGTLHLDHLATVRHSPANERTVALSAFQLSRACGLGESETRKRLDRVLNQHESEWKSYMGSLGPSSFIAEWANTGL